MLYFPYNAQDLAKVSYEDFSKPIFESLERVADILEQEKEKQLGATKLLALADAEEVQPISQSQEVGVAGQQSQEAGGGLIEKDEDDVMQQDDEDDNASGTKRLTNKPISMSQVTQSVAIVANNSDNDDVAGGSGTAVHGGAVGAANSTLCHQPFGTNVPSQFYSLPELIQKLQIEEHFFKFRDMFNEKISLIRTKRATMDLKMEERSDADIGSDIDQLDNLMEEEECEENHEVVFDQLLESFKESLSELREHNKKHLEKQYSCFTNAYKQAEEKANEIIQGQNVQELARPDFPYNPTKIHEYGLDFLSYIDPHFVADIKQNYEWYLQNQNEVLLNVNYPSKLEKEFLRHIEQWQQEKNDLNYKRILQQLAEGADDPNNNGPNGLNIQRYNSLSAHKRSLVVQEDAQCAICNNGDYEDEDLIVFCGACNIPVHQRCYGIDKIPDNDWICNNCWAFNLRRGIMVKCILCPKRGGAMKPTNLFRTHEHFMRYYTAAQKKKGLQHQNYFASLAAQSKTSMNNQLTTSASGGPYTTVEHSSQIACGSGENQQQVDLAALDDEQGELKSAANSIKMYDESQQQNQVEKVNQTNLQVKKQASSSRSQRLQFFEREDKNHALSSILGREGNFQEALILQTKESEEADFPQNKIDLHFLKSEAIAEIPEDYTFFLQRNEQRLESPDTVPTETLYEWVHLSCAMWIPGPSVTPKTPVRMSKIDTKRFDLQCIICGKRNSGACIQCQHSRCMISFHIECARRANYFLEVERVDRQSNYRVFCEKHRPLKIVREMEEKDKQTLDEVYKFSKVIDRCLDKYAKDEIKQNAKKRLQPFSKPPAPEPPSKREILAEKKKQRLNLILQKRQQRENEKQALKEQNRIKKEQERLERELQKKQKQEAALALQLKKKQAIELAKKLQQQEQQQTQNNKNNQNQTSSANAVNIQSNSGAKNSSSQRNNQSNRNQHQSSQNQTNSVKQQNAESAQAVQKTQSGNQHQTSTSRQKSTVSVSKPEQPAVISSAPPKWKDKDKKQLFERVRDRFLQLFKLRINVVRVDPMVKIKKQQEMLQKKKEKEMRKKEKKLKEKLEDRNKQVARYIARKILLGGGQRSGLRSRSSLGYLDAPMISGEMDQSAQLDMSPSAAQQPYMDQHNMNSENPELDMQQRNKKEDVNMSGNDYSSLAARHQANNNPSKESIGNDFFQASENNLITVPKDDSESSNGGGNGNSRRPKVEDLLAAPEEVDPYFKFATPTCVQELDWAITFSKYDFPWHEIKFGQLSAKECYRMYTSQIRDAQTFYKKVLGGKDKYKKYIAKQLDEPQRIFFGASTSQDQAQSAQNQLPLEANQNVDGLIVSNESEIENFCKCKGKYQSQTGCFVMCESEDDCINGGWLHPECTSDLFKMSQEQIDKLDKWYCEDCVERRRQNQNKQQNVVVSNNANGSPPKNENDCDLDEGGGRADENNQLALQTGEQQSQQLIQQQTSEAAPIDQQQNSLQPQTSDYSQQQQQQQQSQSAVAAITKVQVVAQQSQDQYQSNQQQLIPSSQISISKPDAVATTNQPQSALQQLAPVTTQLSGASQQNQFGAVAAGSSQSSSTVVVPSSTSQIFTQQQQGAQPTPSAQQTVMVMSRQHHQPAQSSSVQLLGTAGNSSSQQVMAASTSLGMHQQASSSSRQQISSNTDYATASGTAVPQQTIMNHHQTTNGLTALTAATGGSQFRARTGLGPQSNANSFTPSILQQSQQPSRSGGGTLASSSFMPPQHPHQLHQPQPQQSQQASSLVNNLKTQSTQQKFTPQIVMPQPTTVNTVSSLQSQLTSMAAAGAGTARGGPGPTQQPLHHEMSGAATYGIQQIVQPQPTRMTAQTTTGISQHILGGNQQVQAAPTIGSHFAANQAPYNNGGSVGGVPTTASNESIPQQPQPLQQQHSSSRVILSFGRGGGGLGGGTSGSSVSHQPNHQGRSVAAALMSHAHSSGSLGGMVGQDSNSHHVGHHMPHHQIGGGLAGLQAAANVAGTTSQAQQLHHHHLAQQQQQQQYQHTNQHQRHHSSSQQGHHIE